ncbi:hypothetical protein RUND412_004015 [Rhizina undulata]
MAAPGTYLKKAVSNLHTLLSSWFKPSPSPSPQHRILRTRFHRLVLQGLSREYAAKGYPGLQPSQHLSRFVSDVAAVFIVEAVIIFAAVWLAARFLRIAARRNREVEWDVERQAERQANRQVGRNWEDKGGVTL